MSLLELMYDGVLTIARPLLELGVRSGRSGRAIAGRREAIARFRRWSRRERDESLPLVWVHAPSVGEALMAQAIIEQVRARTACQVAFTFFSPSAERIAETVGADVHAYLPWDTRHDVRTALGLLDPAVIAFVRTEIWPTLVREARSRRARAVLVNAPLAATSSRLRPLARLALGRAYAALDAVGTVSPDDIPRFQQLGVARERIVVTGDARFDQVVSRVARINRESPLLTRLRDEERPAIIAGSTWPPDEDMLVQALPALMRNSGARLIIAPHEPTPAALERLGQQLANAGIENDTLSAVETGTGRLPDVVVVDRVGVLADAYAVGRVAYVGGGFGTSGLHSVIEPAALGLPVVFGPEHGNAREASELVAHGGAAVVRDAAELTARLTEYMTDDIPGRAARDFVATRTGGAARNARIISDFLPGPASGGREGERTDGG